MAFDYSSETATDSGDCAEHNCPDVLVTIIPTSGSMVTVPTIVTLSANVEGATIRYTTDGTEPDSLSTTYTGPITITSPNTIIKAIAFTEDCIPAETPATATFSNPSFPFVFSYACDTPDNAGQWGVFVPNGTNDWHWQLQFTLAALTTIKRLELYQLDAAGNWTTGQVWSTDSPITTPVSSAFASFPLLVFIAAVQQWAAYQSSLGAWAAGTYTWDLYGDQAVPAPATNFFRLDMILDDDSRLSQTIGATCTAAPPLCPPPAAPSLAAVCLPSVARIDATFTVTLGRNWKLYAALLDCGGDGEFAEIATGVGTGAAQTYQHTGLQEGCLYSYYISVDAVGCGFKDSNVVSLRTNLFPTVTISSDKLTVDPGETFTLSWDSDQLYTSVCNGCLAGEILTPFGCKPGNAAGSQATSEAVCGVYTYEVSGCNPCGTVTDSVQVEVRCTATCVNQPATIQIADPLTYLCASVDVINHTCNGNSYDVVCGSATWDGRLYLCGTCFWCAPSVDLGLMFGCYDAETNCGPRLGSGVICFFDSTGPRWVLNIGIHSSLDGGAVSNVYHKLVGNGPAGVYNRVSGTCGPNSITVT